jgi:polysaccharide biosynthesis transport protein
MASSQPYEQDAFTAEPHSVDLRDYWSIMRRRWLLITVVTVIGVLAAVGYSAGRGHSYTATAEVAVQPVTQGPLNQSTQATSQVNMITEQAIAQSGPVIQQAAGTLGLPASKLEAETANRLSVTVPASTLTTSTVLQISWRASSRQAAQQGADAFASAYLSYRHRELAGQIAVLQQTLQGQVSSLRTQIGKVSAQLTETVLASTSQVLTIQLNQLDSQASTIEAQLAALPTYNDSGGTMVPAVLPNKASGVSRSVFVGIGFILGLLVGLAVAFARDLLDDRVRDAAQLEQRLGAPVLAIMPSAEAVTVGRQRSPTLQSATVAIAADPDSRAADAARVLRATVVALSSRRDLRALMVSAGDTSTSAGLVIAELGIALAESGKRVLLVASDTRGSVLPDIFDVAGSAGLKELLVQGGDPEALTQSPAQASGAALPAEVAGRLAVLPSGKPPACPLSALDSSRMADALRKQREAYDLVLLDAPTGSSADMLTLASHVDGVIVLAREAHTRGKDLLTLAHRLGEVDAPLVGSVLVTRMRLGRRRHMPIWSAPTLGRTAVGRSAPAASAPQQDPDSPATMPLSKVRDDMATPVAQVNGLERPR